MVIASASEEFYENIRKILSSENVISSYGINYKDSVISCCFCVRKQDLYEVYVFTDRKFRGCGLASKLIDQFRFNNHIPYGRITLVAKECSESDAFAKKISLALKEGIEGSEFIRYRSDKIVF